MSNWFEATPTATGLSELNATSDDNLNIGTSGVNLGTPYVTPATFGQAPGVHLEYRTASGEIVEGLVEYTGSAAENNLLLLRGAVPGPNGGYVVIRETNKL